jgi:zinc transport system permease protein
MNRAAGFAEAAVAAPDPFDALLTEPSSRSAASPPNAETKSDKPAVTGATRRNLELQDSTSLRAFGENWPLYRDPVLCAALAGAALGGLGVFVVLRRAVFVTATLSQAAGLGVALAFYVEIQFGLQISPVLAALAASALTTLLVSAKPRLGLAKETQIGFAFALTSALAVLVGDRIAQETHDIAAILFGTAVLVRPLDVWSITGGAALTLFALGLLGRGLAFSGFDPEGARVQGLPVRALEVGFWLVFASVVSVSTRALGALPVFAFSVVPGAAALFVASRLSHAVLLASLLGLVAGALGYVAAFRFSLPVGATEAVTAAALGAVLCGVRALTRSRAEPRFSPR